MQNHVPRPGRPEGLGKALRGWQPWEQEVAARDTEDMSDSWGTGLGPRPAPMIHATSAEAGVLCSRMGSRDLPEQEQQPAPRPHAGVRMAEALLVPHAGLPSTAQGGQCHQAPAASQSQAPWPSALS